MRSSLKVLLILLAVSLLCSIGADRSLKDVKKCLKKNLKGIIQKCEDKLPGKPEDFRKCFIPETKGGFPRALLVCLKDKGITTNESCINFQATPGTFEITTLTGYSLPPEAMVKMSAFLACANGATPTLPDCFKGCAGDSPSTSTAFSECLASSLSVKTGQHDPFSDCLKSITS